MSKKIIAVCMGVLLGLGLVALPAKKASAAEATTIYVDLVSNTVELLKKNSTTGATDYRNYIQGRVLLLDANGNLATTFAGSPIADATLELQSVNAGSDFQYATDIVPATPSFSAAGGEKVSINLDGAYQEFAVRYDNGAAPLVDFTGAETLKFTLKKGTTSLTPQTADITIKAPEADCYIVRTGSISTLPEVLDELSTTQKANDGATSEAGSSVTVHLFAAKYSGGKYYFTDNVPANGKMVLVQGVVPASYATKTNASTLYSTAIVAQQAVTVVQAMMTLAGGYASSSVQVSDLKIPDVIRLLNTSTNAGAMDGYINGTDYTMYWFPFPLGTRLVGDQLNDVATSDDIIQISNGNSGIGLSSAAPSLIDTSKHKSGACKKINIVGLPLNTINSNAAAGYTGITKPGFYAKGADNTFQVSALDAYYLLNATKKDWKTKPSSFKAAGRSGGLIFGAIVGQDAYGNPASFSTSSAVTATFALKRTGDAAVTGDKLIIPAAANTWTTARYPDSNGKITALCADQAFLPFAISATFSGAVSATALTDLYIDYANSSNISSKAVEDVDSSAEGVSFYMQNYIGAITTTTYGPSQVGEAIKMSASGQTSSGETAFDLKGVVRKSTGYTQLQLGKKGSTSAQTEYSLANKSGKVAEDDIAIFTKSGTTQPVFIGYTGQTNGTIAVQCVTATAYFEAADPGDIDLSSISNYIGYASAALDDENHDTMYLTNTFMVKDGYGNVYGSFEDAEVQAFAYTVDANGSATTTPFPGADTDVNTIATNFNAVEVAFDLSKITKDNSKAAIVLKSDSGAVSSQPTIIDLKALSSLQAKAYYVPVEGISNHPYIFYFADQNGAMVKPVTVTTVTATDKSTGQEADVDIEADDNGTTTASSTEKLSTKTEYLIKTARLNSGKKSMSIDFESDFGDATLVINPSAADLEKPVIGTPTAIDCGFEIAITDNKGVDAAATQVTVRNASGEDITSTVAKTVASDNGTKAVIQVKGTGAGSFSVDVVAQDDAGNKQTATGLIVSVTTANDCAITAECLEVDPAFVKYGDPATTVTITGKNTNFVQGTTTVDFSCAAVTEGAVTVASSTELTVSVTVPATGDDQNCDITVTTGSESITCANKFQVLSQPPVTCIDNDNDTYGENCPAGNDCDDTNAAVNPGATEVCGDGIDNNCDGQVDEGCVAPCTISVSGTIKAGFILPRIFVITVTGTGDDFSTSSAVTLSGTGVRKLLQIPAGTGIRVIGIVRPSAKGTTVNVSVAGCGDADVTVQ